MGIRSLMEKFEERKTIKRQQENRSIASNLKGLREKRIAEEGHLKLQKLKEREESKLRVAKEENMKRSALGKLVSGLGEGLKKVQANKKKTGILFGKGASQRASDRFENRGVFYEGK